MCCLRICNVKYVVIHIMESKKNDRQKQFQFLSSIDDMLAVMVELHHIKCCPRCILRFCGEKNTQPYRRSIEEVKRMIHTAECNTETSNVVGPGSIEDNNHALPFTCSSCLGILQICSDDKFLNEITGHIEEADYQFRNYVFAISLPLQLLVREHSILLHLKDKFSGLYKVKTTESIASIKEILKWVFSPMLADVLHVNYTFLGPFEIALSFTHPETASECELFVDRKEFIALHAKKRRKLSDVRHITKPSVSTALSKLGDEEMKKRVDVHLLMNYCVFSGRYNKYSRLLSQTPWILEGERKTESSVEELICEKIKDVLQADGYNFSSSGREDVDVCTFGKGRPFVVEYLNPHRSLLPQRVLTQLQKDINDSTKDIAVRDLQIVDKEEIGKLKEGELSKTKSYSALIWIDKKITPEDISFLQNIKDLKLEQKTPIRVLHRRPLAVRVRSVHTMSAEFIDEQHFRLKLCTQAGTYIKEFVHGDFGRTQPSLGTLMKANTDILELDVESVNVDWPRQLET
ncbi:tRNA pseudouridine synthase Pus10-like [Saccoglossus kowalevskii]|uniref:tRNA pseudouridine(55) synthase n=1 Tax=Saccoglossus kowalevskii TaxID=10224 RepID=A0ABM0MAK1_SACKO|nr:PREDICTED: putative tRNA pseudouridine synthase Pus10-like [Saccoglossus kowalevskii]